MDDMYNSVFLHVHMYDVYITIKNVLSASLNKLLFNLYTALFILFSNSNKIMS